MRNLFKFSSVLTTRACVNKYGVPQIGGNYRSGSRSNVLQCRQTDQSRKRASLLHLFLPKTVRNESADPSFSSFAAKRSKICSFTSSEISYVADKQIDVTVVSLCHILYCRQITKSCNQSMGPGDDVLYCRQYQTDQKFPPGGRFSHLLLPTNRSGSAVDLGDATVFTGKQPLLSRAS